jgi:serine protease Do
MRKNIVFVAVLSLLSGLFLIPNTSESQLFQKNPPVLKLSDPLPANLFVELAKAINPAVVNISTSVIPRGRQRRDPMMEMLEQFYGMPINPQGQGTAGKPQRMGLGTGFVIREDGLIVTNAHVINGADVVEVQLTENSDKQYKAEVIGSDERTDIALIKIKPEGKLVVASLGESSDSQVGEWVVAFGNPYGHGHTMTKGIISSLGREIQEINRLPLIQTDASINPGNSGGPLVNSKGLVIGVNSAIDARAQGIGFAIPIDEVKRIIPQLEKSGSIRKGYLGVVLGDIDPAASEGLGLDENKPGAVIMNVDDGPAKSAGIKRFDIVTEFNGKKIRSSRDLSDTVADTEPGKKIKVKVLRNKKNVNIDLVLAERPSDQILMRKARLQPPTAPDPQEAPRPQVGVAAPYNIGFNVTDLTPELRNSFSLAKDVKHPLIVAVNRDSIANRTGLRVGDLIISINGVEPKSANDVLKGFKKGDKNSIIIARGRGISSMTFDIPK